MSAPILTRFILSLAVLATIATATSSTQTANAANPRDFNPGRIIDDSIFYNKDAMGGVQGIQNFLNTHVPACDTWGTGPSGYGNLTRAQYAQQRGWHGPPYACLQNYHENPTTKETSFEKGGGYFTGGQSAAQIIWDASQEYGINPQVLLVMLRKESAGPLTADNWPLKSQYKYAMGYACPDSGPNYSANCDESKAGFYNQIRLAAWQLRYYANNINTYNYRPYRNNYIQYNPNPDCGGKNVYIENIATASLYIYTPYVPNDAALDAYPGEAPCGAYGNRNFFMMFSDWFGSTQVYDPYGWNLIRTADDSRVYLVVGNTKRWVPSGELFDDWNLDIKPVQIVTQSELDSIPTIPQLDRLGLYNNRYYYVDGGKKYWLSNDDLLKAYGQADKLAIASPAYIPLSTIPDGGEATFYASNPATNRVSRLISGKHYMINSSDADRWRANPTQLSANAFDNLPVAANLDYRLAVNGVKYLVDDGRLLKLDSEATINDFSQSSSVFVDIPSEVMGIMKVVNASSLIQPDGVNAWFILKDGIRYYTPSSSMANAWGLSTSPLVISSRLMSAYPQSGSTAPLIVKQSGTSRIYLLDGKKRELTGAAYDSATSSLSPTIEVSASALTSVNSGEGLATPLLQAQGTSDLYSLTNGTLQHIPNSDVLHGLGYPRKYPLAVVGKSFVQSIAVTSATMLIQNGNTTYFLQDGNAFSIDQGVLSEWTYGSNVTSYLGTNFANRFDVREVQLGVFVAEGPKKYTISNGVAHDVTRFQDAVLPDGQTWKPVALFGMKRSESGHLVKSSDSSDPRLWLLNEGKKISLVNYGQIAAFTKQSSLRPGLISPVNLGTYTEESQAVLSPIVYSEGRGFKLLDEYGAFYGFTSGDDLTHYLRNNVATKLSYSTYATHDSQKGNMTRLVKDPSGRIYWVENGKKHWITNGDAYQRYASVAVTSIHWNLTDWLPNGPAIN